MNANFTASLGFFHSQLDMIVILFWKLSLEIIIFHLVHFTFKSVRKNAKTYLNKHTERFFYMLRINVII
jgi:hypothetical protein